LSDAPPEGWVTHLMQPYFANLEETIQLSNEADATVVGRRFEVAASRQAIAVQ
jgi:hypothetical protein